MFIYFGSLHYVMKTDLVNTFAVRLMIHFN